MIRTDCSEKGGLKIQVVFLESGYIIQVSLTLWYFVVKDGQDQLSFAKGLYFWSFDSYCLESQSVSVYLYLSVCPFDFQAHFRGNN